MSKPAPYLRKVKEFISPQIPSVLGRAKTNEESEFVSFTGVNVPTKAVVWLAGLSGAINQSGLRGSEQCSGFL